MTLLVIGLQNKEERKVETEQICHRVRSAFDVRLSIGDKYGNSCTFRTLNRDGVSMYEILQKNVIKIIMILCKFVSVKMRNK